jgi:hypothetical protein
MTSSLDHFFCFIGFSKRSFAGNVILSNLRNGWMKDKMTSSLDHFFCFIGFSKRSFAGYVILSRL